MRKARKRSKILKTLAVCLVVGVVIAGSVAVAAYAYFNKITFNLQSGLDDETQAILDSAEQIKISDPFYMLLIGVDSSEERDESGEFEGSYRSDSIILARINPKTKTVTLVSLHRDALVSIPGYGTDKLNSAYALGGASLLIKTVNQVAGVNISHYAEVNFDALVAVVDALGGIDVNVPMEIDDVYTGYLPAGYQTLNGEQTLIFCRSRHAYDDYGDGDVYRAANQRQVLSAIASKLLSSDATTMANAVNLVSQYVTTDLSVSEIVSLGITMMGMDVQNNFYQAMMPTEGLYINDTWYEEILESSWEEMMERVDEGLPPTEEDLVDDATGIVLANSGE